jgi:peptidoglycan hydrolase-like protein with peptidoglycan-binding domain
MVTADIPPANQSYKGSSEKHSGSPTAAKVHAGFYDTATEVAARTFQEKRGLIVDGVVGEKTWSVLTAETNDKQREHADRWLGEADLKSAAQQLQVDLAVTYNQYNGGVSVSHA